VQLEILRNVIDKIRQHPSLYLGKNSITAFNYFIAGYEMALFDLRGAKQVNIIPIPFYMFHWYVANVYGVGKTAKGWRTLILEACGNDEEKALDTFWNIYDAFCKIDIVRGKCCIINENNIKHHHSNFIKCRLINEAEQHAFYDNPIQIFIFELSESAGYICVARYIDRYELQRDIYLHEEDFDKELTHVFGQLNWELINWNESLANTMQIDL